MKSGTVKSGTVKSGTVNSGTVNSGTVVRSFYEWHRRLGVCLSLPIIFIAITGVLLNHSQLLKLEQIFIKSPYLLEWYGMTPTRQPLLLEWEQQISQLEDLVFVDGRLVRDNFGVVVGAVGWKDLLVIVSEDSLLALERDTLNTVESIGRESLPKGKVIAVGKVGESLLLDTEEGRYRADRSQLVFVADLREGIPAQLRQSIVPEALHAQMLEQWRSRGLSLWRVVIDLHSGRIFGSAGVFLADLAGVVLLLLVGSGLYVWRVRTSK